MRIRIKPFIGMLIRGRQTNADPDPGQTLKSQTVEFLHENILGVGDRSKDISKKVQKPL
jgi:hypothetical protein